MGNTWMRSPRRRNASAEGLIIVLLEFVILQILIIFILVIVGIGMKRIVGVEEEVAQAHGQVLSAQGALAGPGHLFEVARLLAQHAQERFLPGLVLGQRMVRVLGHALDGVA